jgi:hypothetical protein
MRESQTHTHVCVFVCVRERNRPDEGMDPWLLPFGVNTLAATQCLRAFNSVERWRDGLGSSSYMSTYM